MMIMLQHGIFSRAYQIRLAPSRATALVVNMDQAQTDQSSYLIVLMLLITHE